MGIASGVFAPPSPTHTSTKAPAESQMYLGCPGLCRAEPGEVGVAVVVCIAAVAIAVSRWRQLRRRGT